MIRRDLGECKVSKELATDRNTRKSFIKTCVSYTSVEKCFSEYDDGKERAAI